MDGMKAEERERVAELDTLIVLCDNNRRGYRAERRRIVERARHRAKSSA